MKKRIGFISLAVLATATWIGAAPALAHHNPCDEIDMKSTCSGPVVGFPGGSCPNPYQPEMKCLAPNEPPEPVTINCEYTNNGYICEVWPQSDELGYAYDTSDHATLPEPASGPFVYVGCAGSGQGSIFVTVSNGSGTAGASQSLWCP